MVNINWDVVFYFGSMTLKPAASGIAVPTYGNYGGPGYSEGVFAPPSPPYEPAVDVLDAQFLAHDVASAAALSPSQQSEADLALLQSVVALDPVELDAEASLYAGLTTLTMIGRLAAEGDLNLLSPIQTFVAVVDAAHDIGHGVAGLDAEERQQAQDWLLAAADTTLHAFTESLAWPASSEWWVG